MPLIEGHIYVRDLTTGMHASISTTRARSKKLPIYVQDR
jgi:hypothetical protein